MKDLEKLLAVAAKVTLPPEAPMAAKKDSMGELYLYREIGPADMGGIGAEEVVAALNDLRGVNTLAIHINSIGGSVFEGLAIYNALMNFPAKEKIVYVDALAASAASFIAMAGTKIVMAPEAMQMIHLPHAIAGGSAADLRAMADLLDKTTESLLSVYNRRTSLPVDQIRSMLEAETWLNAEEAVAQGFADEILGAKREQPKRMAAASPVKLVAAFSETRKRIANAEVAAARIVRDSLKKGLK